MRNIVLCYNQKRISGDVGSSPSGAQPVSVSPPRSDNRLKRLIFLNTKIPSYVLYSIREDLFYL